MLRLISTTAVMAGLMLTPHLRAGEWVTVASACVPDEDTAGKYQADFGRFQFLGNNTGNIGARCNVTNPNDSLIDHDPDWNLMEITYNDPDGLFSGSQVVVSLRRVNKFTGDSFLIAEFDSNAYPPNPQLRTIAFNHNFNFESNGYYVSVSVRRTNTSLMPRVQRVRLFVATNPG